MIRRTTVLIAGVLLGLAHVGTAIAGGWAITQIDDAPAAFETDTTYEIRYTILQHGRTPAEVESTSIILTPSDTGEALTFPGEPAGQPGTYVAQVNLPRAGSWSWSVSQGWFGIQDLGTIEVSQVQGSAGGVPLDGALRVGLSIAFLVVLGLLAVQVVTYRAQSLKAGLEDSAN